jgi:hypothetical protein
MRLRKGTLDRMIARAKKAWGIPTWEITYEFGVPEYMAENQPEFWTEHRAHLVFDENSCKTLPRDSVYRLVLHELGHVVVAPIWRVARDWVCELEPDGKRQAIFERQCNTAENDVIDFLIRYVMEE